MNNDEVDITLIEKHHQPVYLFNPKKDTNGNLLWPASIKLLSVSFVEQTSEQIYIPKVTTKKHISILDDNAIGHCICENCHKSVGVSDIFCKWCGAKFTSKTFTNEL